MSAISCSRTQPPLIFTLACPRSYVRLAKAYQDACAMDAMPEQIARQPPPSALFAVFPARFASLTSRYRNKQCLRPTFPNPSSSALAKTVHPSSCPSECLYLRMPLCAMLPATDGIVHTLSLAAARPSSSPPVRNICVGIAPSARCSKRAISSSSRAHDEASPPCILFASPRTQNTNRHSSSLLHSISLLS